MHKISAYVMPGTFEIQLPHVYQRLLNLYLVLKTSLVFPSSWDKVVCFLASCLEEEGMDPCDAFCMQSLSDILWLILWEENWVLKRTRDKKWQCCITIYLIRLVCLRFGSLLSHVIAAALQDLSQWESLHCTFLFMKNHHRATMWKINCCIAVHRIQVRAHGFLPKAKLQSSVLSPRKTAVLQSVTVGTKKFLLWDTGN